MIEYCKKHHRYFDTDYETECKKCSEDNIEEKK